MTDHDYEAALNQGAIERLPLRTPRGREVAMFDDLSPRELAYRNELLPCVFAHLDRVQRDAEAEETVERIWRG
jgi:hypothetical protein